MKKLILIITGLFAGLFVFAQSNTEEIDLIQSMYGIEKKAIVKEFVQPKAINKDAFWNVYEKYEADRKILGKERINLLEQFATQYEKMTNDESTLWMKKVIALDDKQDKLIVSYYKKVSKVTTPIVAMRFYQLEIYLITAIRFEILNEMPFVEDK
ncbi:MAG: hypothetical protein H8E34_08530 [Bacteroidetes bacterium]|nr:hypothetical protein [Bacteroidota bacterium]MBL6943902.1 hypothetical protein [Bacteroidales bacterium]